MPKRETLALSPHPKGEKSIVRVVIETPKGSRNKYAFDHKLGGFRLTKVLPEGMVFPYDFGFVPSTRAPDGDPIDVLLLMDEPAFTGCVVESRLVGVIEGEQTEDGKTVRNDRLLAVASENHTFSDLKDVADLNEDLIREVGEFFVNYHALNDTKFEVLDVRGPKAARRCLARALRSRK